MQFTELGTQNEKTMVLLPGTGCTWELNFSEVIDDLSARYHLICVDYDGFETDPAQRTDFTDILTIVSKVEDYILEKYSGRVDAAYGSSLGGTLAAQLAVRGRVHVDHCFIGGSDLDEGGKLVAKLATAIAGTWLENSIRDEKKAEKLKSRLGLIGMDAQKDNETSKFLDGFIAGIRSLAPGTVSREFYSDYITRLPKDICVSGTIVHVIYALKMGKKYEKRYLTHFRDPDIRRFDMQHEGWLFQKTWRQPVLDTIAECMAMPTEAASGSAAAGGQRVKPDYKNWVPNGMIAGFAAGTAALALAAFGIGKAGKNKQLPALRAAGALAGAGAAALGGVTAWCAAAHSRFSYDGSRKLSKEIIDTVAKSVNLPEGGIGLDVGCGSGALTIACAKRNPQGKMLGVDRWGKEYASFSRPLCERNAEAEGVSNVSFAPGNALKLDFADETFDAVCSNYVYHNIPSRDRQAILLETLRVLKKGGTFAIHDIFSQMKYGDMQAFVRKLKDMGYEDVRLIDTTNGNPIRRSEAAWIGLTGSAVLTGRK